MPRTCSTDEPGPRSRRRRNMSPDTDPVPRTSSPAGMLGRLTGTGRFFSASSAAVSPVALCLWHAGSSPTARACANTSAARRISPNWAACGSSPVSLGRLGKGTSGTASIEPRRRTGIREGSVMTGDPARHRGRATVLHPHLRRDLDCLFLSFAVTQIAPNTVAGCGQGDLRAVRPVCDPVREGSRMSRWRRSPPTRCACDRGHGRGERGGRRWRAPDRGGACLTR